MLQTLNQMLQTLKQMLQTVKQMLQTLSKRSKRLSKRSKRLSKRSKRLSKRSQSAFPSAPLPLRPPAPLLPTPCPPPPNSLQFPPMNQPPTLSIIVPTMNEAGNIRPLLERLGRALAGISLEVLFVDDSRDDTAAIITAAMPDFPFTVRLIARPPERRNGLSGAVVEGFQAVRGEWLCVMDGDLQHPPEVVPQMLAQAQTAGADMVVGSRKANLLGPMGLTLFRSFTSQSLTILARALFPRSLKDVSDPLTGLFLVRREKVLIERLRPNGFKILLEILVRCPHLRITEVPFDFATRHEGESKADVREGLRFFQHLLRLRLTAHQRPLGRYLAVSFSVLLLTLALLVGLVEGAGWSPLWAAVLASELSLLWSFWGKRFAFGEGGDLTQGRKGAGDAEGGTQQPINEDSFQRKGAKGAKAQRGGVVRETSARLLPLCVET